MIRHYAAADYAIADVTSVVADDYCFRRSFDICCRADATLRQFHTPSLMPLRRCRRHYFADTPISHYYTPELFAMFFTLLAVDVTLEERCEVTA